MSAFCEKGVRVMVLASARDDPARLEHEAVQLCSPHLRIQHLHDLVQPVIRRVSAGAGSSTEAAQVSATVTIASGMVGQCSIWGLRAHLHALLAGQLRCVWAQLKDHARHDLWHPGPLQ